VGRVSYSKFFFWRGPWYVRGAFNETLAKTEQSSWYFQKFLSPCDLL
jgi:hypothetical protein